MAVEDHQCLDLNLESRSFVKVSKNLPEDFPAESIHDDGVYIYKEGLIYFSPPDNSLTAVDIYQDKDMNQEISKCCLINSCNLVDLEISIQSDEGAGVMPVYSLYSGELSFGK